MTETPLLLYRRAGCHLCDEARAILDALLAERRATGRRVVLVRELDIAADPELEASHGRTIPVLELAGQRLDLAIRATQIRRFLEDLLDGPAPLGIAERSR